MGTSNMQKSSEVIYSGSGRWVVVRNDSNIIAILIGLLRDPAPNTDTFIWFEREVGVGAQGDAIIAILIGLLRSAKWEVSELGFSGGLSYGFEKTFLAKMRNAGFAPQTTQLGAPAFGTILRLGNTSISIHAALASGIGGLLSSLIRSPRDVSTGQATGRRIEKPIR